MNKIEKNLLVVFRVVLAIIFIYAGAVKILNPVEFSGDIDNYQMLPWVLITLMAIILPWVEVICGLLLISGRWLKPASFLILVMNIVFIIAITSAVLRGLDISCGCFSMHSTQVGMMKIAEDIFYAILSLYIFLKAKA